MTELDQIRTGVKKSIEASIEAKRRLLEDEKFLTKAAEACSILVRSLKQGNKVLIFGNGGSAADSQHIAAEFVGRFAFERRALPALALSVNSSCVTAIGNDYGYDVVFSRQVEALGQAGDVAIGISTSGNSANVVRGIEAARGRGIHTIALTGAKGGKLESVVEICLKAPSDETPRIQECHILIGHILCELAERLVIQS